MKPRNLRQLLGGFAAGTLTPEEREALFQAALEDQALFDALAEEEGLRELLADPIARAKLLGDLREEAAHGIWRRLAGWLRKPATLALAGSAAALLLVVGVVRFTQRETERPKLVAQAPRPVETPPAAAMVQPPKARPTMRRATPPAESQQQVAPPAAVFNRPEARPTSRAAPPATASALEKKRADQPAPAPIFAAVVLRGAEDAWRETTPGAAFREGDQVRLRVRAAEDGYVLVTVQDGSSLTSLGPPAGMAVRGGQDLIVPPTGALTLAGTSGEKLLRLSFSTEAMAAGEIGMQFTRGAGAPAAAKTAAKVSPPPQQIEIRLLYRPQ